jgi:hypothetical protein
MAGGRGPVTLLLSAAALRARRSVAAGPLRPLAASLAADLEPLLTRDPFFPTHKALLSRKGGRCETDGVLLEFDPFQPDAHRCPMCGAVYRGELHHRFWIYWYQLWLAERAVQAAALADLGVDERFAALAERILDGYVDRYAAYPNIDNVLGPTRLFFSTYLESIWLLQICVATDLLDARAPALAGRVRDRIIEPSRAIIVEYDEGASNRQVWNDAALLAAARVLGDAHGGEQAVFGASGLTAHLSTGLLTDGTWFEGENYHMFAHRGLWYGVTMAEQAGIELPAALVDRFQRGFSTPFATALPDFTLPSRRDSQYAISLRQWRMAEHCELGLARREDAPLLAALQQMYSPDAPPGDTGRRNSSADVERNVRSAALTRADLNWRALLCARPSLPPLEAGAPESALLPAQGIAVFRRDGGSAYVALDYGHSGGGHGHPDRLNVLLSDHNTRWLDDYGTGSYVDPSLHWYRSTLAHNAPLIDGRSQLRVDGELRAYHDCGEAGWIVATANGITPDVQVERTLVVMPGYMIDLVDWSAPRTTTFDLPLHADLEFDAGVDALRAASLHGGDGTEDGFSFVRDTAYQRTGANVLAHARATNGAQILNCWTVSSHDTVWWRATAGGPPGGADQTFRVARTRAAADLRQTVLAWRDVADVEIGNVIRVTLSDGVVHTHVPTDAGWRIHLDTGNAQRAIDLGGRVAASSPAVAPGSPHSVDAIRLPLAGAWLELGEPHYRRSEQSWSDAGGPTATVYMARTSSGMHLGIHVAQSDLSFAPAKAVNDYDNEPAEINGDGVQLYVQGDNRLSGWTLIPQRDSAGVRIRQIEGWTSPRAVTATWRVEGNGYVMDVQVPGAPPVAIDVIINEMPLGRGRRRGQLVLSGARGEFVYLRGDRHEVHHLIPIRHADG